MSEPTRLAQRIHPEYQAVPGLKLTSAQAARLWSARETDCAAALNALVAAGRLWLAPSGRYAALPASDGKPVKSDPTAAIPYFVKAAKYNGDLQKNPYLYNELAAAYGEGPVSKLSEDYKKYIGQPESTESKLVLANLNQAIDR